MDRFSIYELFNNTLKNKPWWSRFANSQFITMMSNLGYQIVNLSKNEAENAIAEVNLSTAIQRQSILAGAEDKGYIGRFITPSAGLVYLKNKTNQEITIPAGTLLLSNSQLPYTVEKTHVLEPNQTVEKVRVLQQEKVTLTYKVTEDKPWLEIVFPKDLSNEVVSIDVYVNVDGRSEYWENRQRFRLSRQNSHHYIICYKPTDQYSVKFGNNIIGKQPPVGSEIEIQVMASRGITTLVEGQTLKPIANMAHTAKSIECKTTTPITGGMGRESIEETRQNALYYTAYDDQPVWAGDYAYFIQTHIPDLTWLNVWGEEIQEKVTGYDVRNINKIFICGHKANVEQADLYSEIASVLKSAPVGLNLSFKYMDKVDVPYRIIVNGKCQKYLNPDDVKEHLIELLGDKFGENASGYISIVGETPYEHMNVSRINKTVESTNMLVDFEIVFPDQVIAEQLNEFVFLNIQASEFNISIKGDNDGGL